MPSRKTGFVRIVNASKNGGAKIAGILFTYRDLRRFNDALAHFPRNQECVDCRRIIQRDWHDLLQKKVRGEL